MYVMYVYRCIFIREKKGKGYRKKKKGNQAMFRYDPSQNNNPKTPNRMHVALASRNFKLHWRPNAMRDTL